MASRGRARNPRQDRTAPELTLPLPTYGWSPFLAPATQRPRGAVPLTSPPLVGSWVASHHHDFQPGWPEPCIMSQCLCVWGMSSLGVELLSQTETCLHFL